MGHTVCCAHKDLIQLYQIGKCYNMDRETFLHVKQESDDDASAESKALKIVNELKESGTIKAFGNGHQVGYFCDR